MPCTVIGLYGTVMDQGGKRRWDRWRPTLSIFQHPDRIVDHLELLVPPRWLRRSQELVDDIRSVSPETQVTVIPTPMENPWDFAQVYGALLDYARTRPQEDDEELLVHITTGTHVAQICLFLLVESNFLRGRLLQTGPPRRGSDGPLWDEIDLDLSRYDALARRFAEEHAAANQVLKQGIQTRSPDFNRMIEELEQVSALSTEPILLTGPSGAGKSALAKQITALKRRRGQLAGPLVQVNCATLLGDKAMAALFGHSKGAFTGATERQGLLRAADKGVLFLDEIGELGLDEQAMLLRAIEAKRFLPLGADVEVESDFQLIAGTNVDLRQAVSSGRFRGDLLARIDMWHFELPGLAERRQDIEPNLDFELQKFAQELGRQVAFNKNAKARFLRFALDPASPWTGNFRDLNAAVLRMATLAPGGRIGEDQVNAEIGRLQRRWGGSAPADPVAQVLGETPIDRFDRAQLNEVILACQEHPTAAAAGRALFAHSRTQRATQNDGDRLRKYLAKWGLDFAGLNQASKSR